MINRPKLDQAQFVVSQMNYEFRIRNLLRGREKSVEDGWNACC